MNLPVQIQARAKTDLRENVAWWSHHRSTEQALRWWDGILEAIESLGEAPARCPLARENGEYPIELRELHFGLGSRPTHRIIFVIAHDAVRVLTVRHAAQTDWNPSEASEITNPD